MRPCNQLKRFNHNRKSLSHPTTSGSEGVLVIASWSLDHRLISLLPHTMTIALSTNWSHYHPKSSLTRGQSQGDLAMSIRAIATAFAHSRNVWSISNQSLIRNMDSSVRFVSLHHSQVGSMKSRRESKSSHQDRSQVGSQSSPRSPPSIGWSLSSANSGLSAEILPGREGKTYTSHR